MSIWPKLTIGHLYPDLLDLYGDRGNVVALQARCRWRGIETEVQSLSLGDDLDLAKLDILFIGGGSDREQSILVQDLQRREHELRRAVETGLVVLAICGGYQLLGKYYQTGGGEKIPGLGILDLWTVAGSKRLIGNVVVDHCLKGLAAERLLTLVGFENHSGKTYLGPEVKALGKVRHGFGNNGEDGTEGVRYRNVFGTYLHGPLLPKNPHLADLLLQLAMQRRGEGTLPALEDSLEERAHRAFLSRVAETKNS